MYSLFPSKYLEREGIKDIANYNVTHGVKGRMKEIQNRFVHTK